MKFKKFCIQLGQNFLFYFQPVLDLNRKENQTCHETSKRNTYSVHAMKQNSKLKAGGTL